MKLYFEQTPEHLKSLQTNTLKKNKFLWFMVLFMAAMLLINLFFSINNPPQEPEFLDNNSSISSTLLSWIIPVVIIVVIWYFIMKMITKQSFKKNKETLFGWREVELSKDHIHYKTSFSDTNFSWDGFSKMDESDSCYFIYLGTRQAIIIPKYAFENENQQAEFKALVASKIQSK